MMHRIAFMAASTGPFPEAAASNFSPAMSNPMLATDFIPTPAVTCRKSSCMRALAVLSFPTSRSSDLFPPGPGGIGSHAYSLTEALSNKGWEMDVFTCGDYSSKQTIVDFDRKQSFKIHRFRRKGWLTYFYRLYDVAHYIRKQTGGENS